MIYEYRCPKCEHVSEHDRPVGDSSGKSLKCPRCKATGLQKIISKPMIGAQDEGVAGEDSSPDSYSCSSSCSSCSTCSGCG